MTHRHLDFPSFVDDLEGMPLERIIAHIQQEMSDLQAMPCREASERFDRELYRRSLCRLHELLVEQRLPTDLSPRERLAYQRLAHLLRRWPDIPEQLTATLLHCSSEHPALQEAVPGEPPYLVGTGTAALP